MRVPLRNVMGKIEAGDLLDRGGRPTLREFLAGLEFDPQAGTLTLYGARVNLQQAEADRLLHRDLVLRLGEEEARIFLLRRGYRMGLNDAAFVEASWPALDRGDAFTAGTRLHMFCGVVRVETIFNDFDFARGRFSAEFLWHNSIEAGEDAGRLPPAARPQCWQQLGYASGYASHFFGRLVVYKEVSCAAEGHRACRVIGRLAEGWGEADPEVRLFRERIVPREGIFPARAVPATPPAAEGVPPLLAPVAARLATAARFRLPLLLAGAGPLGQEEAAGHLLRMTGGAAAQVQRLRAPGLAAEGLRRALEEGEAEGREARVLILTAVERLAEEAQAALTEALRQGAAPRLILLAEAPLARLAGEGLSPALWARLAPMACELPPLSEREDLREIIAMRLEQGAAPFGWRPTAEMIDLLTMASPRARDLDELDAQITALCIALQEGTDPAEALARLHPAPEPDRIEDALEALAVEMAEGRFSLPEHEARLRQIALRQAGGNLSAAARALGISRAQLAYREQEAPGRSKPPGK